MLNCDKDSGAISIGFSSSANWLSTMKLLMIILTSSSLFTAFFSLLLFLRSMVHTSTIVYQYTRKCIFYSIMYLTAFPGAQFLPTDGIFGAMMKVRCPTSFSGGVVVLYLQVVYLSNNCMFFFFFLNGGKVNLVNDGPVTMQLDSSQTSRWVRSK